MAFCTHFNNTGNNTPKFVNSIAFHSKCTYSIKSQLNIKPFIFNINFLGNLKFLITTIKLLSLLLSVQKQADSDP